MDDKARSDLSRELTAVYNDASDDEALRDRLIAQPRTVLAERGIELPATVKVEAEQVEAADKAAETAPGAREDFFARWDRMVERGTVNLKVPPSRLTGASTTDLSDEDLERVSGGIHREDGRWILR